MTDEAFDRYTKTEGPARNARNLAVGLLKRQDGGQAATTYGAGSGTFIRTFETITARYWKIEVPDFLEHYEWEQMQSTFHGAFDFVQPQLHLNTPPDEGAVVKVIAKSEYPIKNSNWIIDQMLVDWKISGGQT